MEQNITYQKATLVALNCGNNDQLFRYSFKELENLCEAVYITSVATVIQNMDRPNPGTYLGKGKLEELKVISEQSESELIIFNDELTPAQLKNISETQSIRVIDRTMLILEIFKKRARTKEAMLQVEIANLKYMLPRLVGSYSNLSKIGGGSNATRGAGETKLELDRRHLEKRIDKAKLELSSIMEDRKTARKQRIANEVPCVSLVGYTNAGKSTTLNSFLEKSLVHDEEKNVFVKNMLFATLETSTRRIVLPTKHEILFTDTVGFISNLPHHLVESFRSTLEEIKESDYILNVVDSSSSQQKLQIETTQKVLNELGVKDIPIIYVFTKSDLVKDNPLIEPCYEPYFVISNQDKSGIDELLTYLDENLYPNISEVHLVLPFDKGDIYHFLKENRRVIKDSFVEEGFDLYVMLNELDQKKYSMYQKK